MEHFIFHNKRRKGISCFLVPSFLLKELIVFLFFTATFCFTFSVYADFGAQDQLDFADGLFAREMHGMAISEYEKFIVNYPEHPEVAKANFMIGESLFYLGKYVEAEEKYKEYLEKFPGGSNILRVKINIAICDIELKNYSKVIKETSELIEIDLSPEEKSEVSFLSGMANLSLGNKEEAKKKLEDAVQFSSSRYAATASYQLGSLYYEDGEFKKAVSSFRKSADLTDDDELKQLSLLGVSQIEFKSDEYESALNGFNQLIADEKTSEEVKSKAVVGVLGVLSGQGRYSEVISLYNDKKESFTSARLKFEATMLAVQAYSKEGMFQEVLLTLEPLLNNEALTQEERDMVLLDKVNALLLTQRISDAESILDSLESSEDMPRYLFFKAEACYLQGAYAEARKNYETILDDYPDSAQSHDAAYGLAHAMFNNEQRREARDAFFSFSEKYPNDKRSARTLYSTILLDKELGLLKEGAKDAKLFIERYAEDSNVKSVWFMLGRFYTDLKDIEPAIQAYQEYLRLYPNDDNINEVYYLLGYNLQVSGSLEESSAYYGRVDREQDSKLYYSAQKNIVQNNITGDNEQKAAEVLAALVKDFPENDINVDTYLWTAKKFIDALQYGAALEVLSLARQKNEQDSQQAVIAYYIGEAQRGLGNYDESIKEYQDCITEDKVKGEFTGAALIGIGLSSKEKGEFEDARQSFEKAIEFNPEDNTVTMRARYNIAELFMQQEQFDEAGRMFMMVGILYDDQDFVADSLHGAALAFHKAGRNDKSNEAYSDLKSKFPSYDKIESLEKELEK